MTPCPTCRHYVIHIHELGQVITALRIAATRHHGLHGRLMNHITVGRRVKAKYAAHLLEHRAAIRGLGVHLLDHANEGAAA